MAFEPGVRFDIVLDAESDKPAAEQQAFVYLSLSAREFAALDDLYCEDPGSKTSTQVLMVAEQIAAKGLVGWRNVTLDGQPIEFDASKLLDVLTATALMSLSAKRRSAEMMGHDDKKKSELPA